MNLLRMAWIEARALHRVLGFWLWGLLLAWLLLTRVQEPVFFRRRGVPFYWASVEAVLVWALALLPLIWRLAQGHAAALWTLQRTRSHPAKIIASWFAIVGYGVLTWCITGLAGIALDGLYGIAPQWTRLLGAAAACLPPLLVLGAMAPGLALVHLGRTQTVFTWLVLMALVLHFLWPGWRSDRPLVDLLGVLQATVAGLFLSLAATYHRVRVAS